MIGLILGLVLIIAGALMLIASRRSRNVAASSGSVAVGKNNSGSITNVTATNAAPQTHGNTLTIVALIVELLGIAVTLWHAYHMVRQ